ncbi:MAG: hypothetical protein WBL19_00810 [Minisyncoccia bacterium]
MSLQEHTTPERLEKYAFLWSEARLVLGAVALIIGGKPLLTVILPTAYGILNVFWLVSGIAALYLLYRWYQTRMLFGAKEKLDLYAFLVMGVTGINLGLVPILGNIGMRIASSKIVFMAAGVLYLVVAYHLFRRWKANNERVF